MPSKSDVVGMLLESLQQSPQDWSRNPEPDLYRLQNETVRTRIEEAGSNFEVRERRYTVVIADDEGNEQRFTVGPAESQLQADLAAVFDNRRDDLGGSVIDAMTARISGEAEPAEEA